MRKIHARRLPFKKAGKGKKIHQERNLLKSLGCLKVTAVQCECLKVVWNSRRGRVRSRQQSLNVVMDSLKVVYGC